MNLLHIDSSFYRLTAAQAKHLSLTGRLPDEGREVKADPAKLSRVKLFVRNVTGDWKWKHAPELVPQTAKQGWIARTPLRYHDGKEVPTGWVWAIRFFWGQQP